MVAFFNVLVPLRHEILPRASESLIARYTLVDDLLDYSLGDQSGCGGSLVFDLKIDLKIDLHIVMVDSRKIIK